MSPWKPTSGTPSSGGSRKRAEATRRRSARATALPALATPRLRLAPWTEADLDDLMALDSDPEVRRYVGDGRVPAEPVYHRAKLRKRVRTDHGAGLGFWTVRAGDGDRFFGWVCLVPLAGWPEVELGYRLKRDAWGQGYATEAGRAALTHGFGAAGLEEIVAVSHPENARSHRVLARLGFRRAANRHVYGRDDLLFFRLPADTFRGASETPA